MERMKLRNIITANLTVFVLFLQSCIGDLPEEQFEKYVLLTKNGWVEQDVEFTSSNEVTISIPISISGTSVNKENVQVTLAYDTLLLNRYNLEKYKLQTELYYSCIPVEAIELEDVMLIPAGSDQVVASLTIDFNKVADLYKDYVLPISIKEVSKYSLQKIESVNILKHSEALYHINRINSFSGDYSGDAVVFKTNRLLKNIGEGVPVPTKTFYALSENECYFYAGRIDRNQINRHKFIVNVKLDESGLLVLSSPNPDLQIVQENCVLQTLMKPVPADARYQMVNKTITFSYTFFNLNDDSEVTNNNNHILRSQGLILRERKELKE